jgi:hypothetical protein
MPIFAIPVVCPDPELLQETHAVLKRVAEVVPHLLQSRLDDKFEAVVEALTPDMNLSPTRLIEAEMKASAITQVLRSGDLVTASQVARLAGYSSSNPSSQPNRWKKAGLLFAVQHKGADYYPLYALDPQNGYKPYPVVASVLSILKERDAWGLAFWFAGINGYLGGKRPQDLIATDPAKVALAAEDEALGLQHG